LRERIRGTLLHINYRTFSRDSGIFETLGLGAAALREEGPERFQETKFAVTTDLQGWPGAADATYLE
jgi:hypothetical protein